ncbi:MAG TPA: B12-binding domain-containing protein [Acidimicrobiia bacterium]|nr:B12-binding domain-containing protein [Acidimicrobiia bacterium]
MPDRQRVLSLEEAAERLGVHYMTAYRYVRLGRLPARQVNGRWTVRAADVAALTRRAHAPRARTAPRFSQYRDRLLRRLLEGDEAGAWGVVEAALAAGAQPRDIYLGALAPALREVGDEWAAGRITVADEHRAAAVASRLVGRLGPRFARRGRRRGTVVLGGAPGDEHGLPAAILADLLRGEGYAVVDHGANTPVDSFVGAARGADALVTVGVSVATGGNERRVRSAVRALHRAVPGVPVLVGGPAVPDDDTARSLGADGWAADGAGVVTVLEALTRRGA